MGLRAPGSREPLKRALDVLLVLASSPVWLPLGVGVALWVRLQDSGPVIYSETRVGRAGRAFVLHKFRTLVHGARGPSVAPHGDPRVTRAGRFLRKWRLDELPQLLDVLRGAMSLVGPRPERAEHLAAIPAAIRRRVSSVRPGLTGPAAIAFLAEDEYLAGVTDPVRTYCQVLLPEKLRLELDYVERGTLLTDLRLIAATLWRVFSPRAHRRSLRMIERLAANATPGEDTPSVPLGAARCR